MILLLSCTSSPPVPPAAPDTAAPDTAAPVTGQTPSPSTGPAAGGSLRFRGSGVAAPDADRVKVRLDDPGTVEPGPPVDVGASDFTIDLWVRGSLAENAAGPVECGANVAWIYGNIVVDRDRYNQDRKFGLSLAAGRPVFGVSGDGTGDVTVCAGAGVLDDAWHHVAVQRRRSDGWIWVFVDGALQAEVDGPDGDVSYPDDGVPGPFCDGPCDGSDPFLVFGAEKHDAGASYPSFSGWLDEVRVSSVLRYDSSFEPPLQPHPLDSDVAALYRFDEGAGTVAADSAGGVAGELRVGGDPSGPSWSSSSPFAPR